MDISDETFLAGAIATVSDRMEVDWAALGNYESVPFHWYRVASPYEGECWAVLIDEEGEVSSKVKSASRDNEDFTKALLKTLSWGAEKIDYTCWFVTLDAAGSANPEWVDAGILKAALKQGAHELQCAFDFDEWSVRSGFSGSRKKK